MEKLRRGGKVGIPLQPIRCRLLVLRPRSAPVQRRIRGEGDEVEHIVPRHGHHDNSKSRQSSLCTGHRRNTGIKTHPHTTPTHIYKKYEEGDKPVGLYRAVEDDALAMDKPLLAGRPPRDIGGGAPPRARQHLPPLALAAHIYKIHSKSEDRQLRNKYHNLT
jgi:hypothetical protein